MLNQCARITKDKHYLFCAPVFCIPDACPGSHAAGRRIFSQPSFACHPDRSVSALADAKWRDLSSPRSPSRPLGKPGETRGQTGRFLILCQFDGASCLYRYRKCFAPRHAAGQRSPIPARFRCGPARDSQKYAHRTAVVFRGVCPILGSGNGTSAGAAKGRSATPCGEESRPNKAGLLRHNGHA